MQVAFIKTEALQLYKCKACIYIIKACIYSFLMMQRKFRFLYKGSLSLIEKKFSYNSLEAIY